MYQDLPADIDATMDKYYNNAKDYEMDTVKKAVEALVTAWEKSL